jgi:hypothetical protein
VLVVLNRMPAAQREPLIFYQGLQGILRNMRILFFAVFVLAGLCAVDVWAFDGRYRKAAWEHVSSQGAMFHHQVNHMLRRLD